MNYARLSKNERAMRAARDIPDGAYVNLGVGMPTLVSNYLPPDREIVLHSENGILGMGPNARPGEEDWDLINAGKEAVTLLAGASFFHHADSFMIIRGGHLDISVLGAYQVSVAGDLANWDTGDPQVVPAVGGAMDLAVGAKQVWVIMDLLTKEGRSKIVETCTYPITGERCVTRVYGDLATLDITAVGICASGIVDGLSHAELERLLGTRLLAPRPAG
ncbi:3-oxoacid CoA-transferase subunit B [Variovorax paradoxus]|nr:3-oxoacid CoA-transferase subunit B [Variovorax paradoxus]MBT2305215.1 3-oxoacid CoA-transferase subunit B [Variovorax paradoxus]